MVSVKYGPCDCCRSCCCGGGGSCGSFPASSWNKKKEDIFMLVCVVHTFLKPCAKLIMKQYLFPGKVENWFAINTWAVPIYWISFCSTCYLFSPSNSFWRVRFFKMNNCSRILILCWWCVMLACGCACDIYRYKSFAGRNSGWILFLPPVTNLRAFTTNWMNFNR